MKQPERKEYLKHKMLQGQCSSDELAELYTLIQTIGAPQEWEDLLQEQWNRSLQAQDMPHVPNELLPGIIKQANWRRRLTGYKKFSMRAAASLVLLISATILYMKFGELARFAETAMMVEHTVPYGKLSRYRLPDGSVVWLNAGSRLTHPRFFLSNERHVSLSGEAFFNVVRDESKPFLIDAHALQVKVLGTSFNVKAYPGDHHNRVTVASGLVQINHEEDSLTVLSKGLQLSYQVPENIYKIDQHDPSLAAHWTTGGLMFNNASFEEVARALEKHFNVTMELESKNVACRFTIVIPPALSLKEVLNKLKLVNDFKYTQHNNKIIITEINC